METVSSEIAMMALPKKNNNQGLMCLSTTKI